VAFDHQGSSQSNESAIVSCQLTRELLRRASINPIDTQRFPIQRNPESIVNRQSLPKAPKSYFFRISAPLVD